MTKPLHSTPHKLYSYRPPRHFSHINVFMVGILASARPLRMKYVLCCYGTDDEIGEDRGPFPVLSIGSDLAATTEIAPDTA